MLELLDIAKPAKHYYLPVIQFRSTINWINLLFTESLELKFQTYLHDIKSTAHSRFCRTETISRCASKQISHFKSCVTFSNHYSESRRLELQKSVLNCFLNSTLWILQYFRKKVNGVYHNLCTATNYGTFSFKNPLKPYTELTSKGYLRVNQ